MCRSAFAFAQAVVFGMFGLRLEQGEASFHPQLPPELAGSYLSNVRAFGRVYSTEKSEG